MIAGSAEAPMRAAMGVAVALHFGAAALLFGLPGASRRSVPPVYTVKLIAAPAGERAIGVVNPPAVEPEAPPPTRAERAEAAIPATSTKAPPRRATPPATPVPPQPGATATKRDAPAPAAGGGPVGGRGADVANVRTEGVEFPFPGYLNNVVRQIALRFKPPEGSQRRAEVFFLLHRDGSVSSVRFQLRSGDYEFDLEAQGAIEAAATASPGFGPLPDGFPDDVLPIVFSFDPRLIR